MPSPLTSAGWWLSSPRSLLGVSLAEPLAALNPTALAGQANVVAGLQIAATTLSPSFLSSPAHSVIDASRDTLLPPMPP